MSYLALFRFTQCTAPFVSTTKPCPAENFRQFRCQIIEMWNLNTLGRQRFTQCSLKFDITAFWHLNCLIFLSGSLALKYMQWSLLCIAGSSKNQPTNGENIWSLYPLFRCEKNSLNDVVITLQLLLPRYFYNYVSTLKQKPTQLSRNLRFFFSKYKLNQFDWCFNGLSKCTRKRWYKSSNNPYDLKSMKMRKNRSVNTSNATSVG